MSGPTSKFNKESCADCGNRAGVLTAKMGAKDAPKTMMMNCLRQGRDLAKLVKARVFKPVAQQVLGLSRDRVAPSREVKL